MTRIDRARFDAATFPAHFTLQTRFDDLDIQGHVNNAAVVVFLQEGRVDFNRQAGLSAKAAGLRMMAAGVTVEYTGEMHFPEPVEIHTGVLSIGRTSFTLGQMIRQAGRSTAYAQVTMVLAGEAGPSAIPAEIRDRLESMAF